MADLVFDTAAIAEAIKTNLEGFDPQIESGTVGRVMEVGDGIARVSGLPNAAVNELLEFQSGDVGLALNLDEDSIGAVVLGDIVEAGDTVMIIEAMIEFRQTLLPVPVRPAIRSEEHTSELQSH